MKEEKLILIVLSTIFFQVSLVWSQSDINWNYDHRLDKNDQLALVKRITDQIDLVNIAKSNTYRDVRITAIEKITDQNVLLEIAINEPYIDVQCAAAQALNDQNQEFLIEFLKNELNSKVREIVVRKINDQTVLSEIAKGDPDKNVRKAAVLGIKDELILLEISKKDQDAVVREAAVKGMTDRIVLTEIVKNDPDKSVRFAAKLCLMDQIELIEFARNKEISSEERISAIEKITDQSVLFELAKDEEVKLPKKAFNAISDQNLLYSIVKSDECSYGEKMDAIDRIEDEKYLIEIFRTNILPFDLLSFPENAFNKITDQTILEEFALNNSNEYTRRYSANKIINQDIIRKIIRHDSTYYVRREAAHALNSHDQEHLIELFKNETNNQVREIILRRINDQSVLTEYAKNDPVADVRKAAVLGIMDEPILIEIAKNDPDNGVRKSAVQGITDENVLIDIFNNEKDESVCKAAAYSLKDINKIIDLAKNHPVSWLRNQFRGMELVTIRGMLTNENGKPLNNRTIYLLPVKNGGIGFSYKDGEISNINSETDINGQFSIIMKLYLFLDNNKFTLGYKKLNKIERLKSSDGSYFEMQFTDIQEVDLGQVIQDDQKTVTFIQYDEPPQPSGGLKQIQENLVYPDIAKKTGVEGRVLVYLQIDIDGTVLKTKIGKSSGSNACDEAAIEAVKSVKWLPAKNKGKPVTVWTSIPVDFKLK